MRAADYLAMRRLVRWAQRVEWSQSLLALSLGSPRQWAKIWAGCEVLARLAVFDPATASPTVAAVLCVLVPLAARARRGGRLCATAQDRLEAAACLLAGSARSCLIGAGRYPLPTRTFAASAGLSVAAVSGGAS